MEFFLFIIFSSLIAYLFFNSEVSDTPLLLKWLGRTLPPLSVLILIFIPFDFVTSFAWLLGFFFTAFSAISILSRTILFFIKKIQKKKPSYKILAVQFIRPTLCIVAFLVAKLCLSASITSANAEAINLALKENKNFLVNKSCLPKDADWKKKRLATEKDNSLEKLYGEYGTKYYIEYKCKGGIFRYHVHINKDTDFEIFNTSNGELHVSYGDYMSPQKLMIDANTNLEKLARMELHIH